MNPDAAAGAVLTIALLLCGCASSASAPLTQAPVAAVASTDPCAMRLHDICGGLLLHFARHARLPAQLSDLDAIPGIADDAPFNCPLSGRPYVYHPTGIVNSGQNERIILYDPLPSHANMRWAVRIEEPPRGIADQPLVARVVALPESFFLLHRR